MLPATIAERYQGPDRSLIERAYAVAEAAHHGQTRLSGEPYLAHPVRVAEFLVRMDMDAATVAAALLHDVLEDTRTTPDELHAQFGDEVAFLVEGVTKLTALPYRSGSEVRIGTDPYVASLKKLFLAMAKDIRVIIIKLADRFHNIETLQFHPPEDRRRIALETLEVYAPIADRLGIGSLKGQLEDLCFPYVYPDEHHALTASTAARYRDRLKYLERVKPIVARYLADAGIEPSSIHARAKRSYSLFQKLRKYDMDMNRIFDLVALRIVVPTVAACYEALGVIHAHYHPLPGRIKDFIAIPKPNGYQSLHTTVFCEKGRIVEIQIRTPEMHLHAEQGIAAHWAYSEAGKPHAAVAAAQEVAWVEQLKASLAGIRTRDALRNIEVDFFRNRIFVFTPHGDIKDLPEGATPIDFAYAVHTELGNSITGAKVNDRIVPLAHELHSGDVVEVTKSKSAKPSLDWLTVVRTSEARQKIKSWFKRNDPVMVISNGRLLLNRALAPAGTSVDKLSREIVNGILATYSCRTLDALLTRVSTRDIDAGELVRKLFPDAATARRTRRPGVRVTRKTKVRPAAPVASAVVINGQRGLMHKLGRCCSPAYGQDICGYITLNHGVTVHLASCPNLARAAPDRILDASWE